MDPNREVVRDSAHDADVSVKQEMVIDHSTDDSEELSDSLEGYRFISVNNGLDFKEDSAEFDFDSEGDEQMYCKNRSYDNLKADGSREMKMWSQPDFLKVFIKLYKSEPCLWKVKSEEYTNRVMREEAYNRLLTFCQSKDITVDLEFVKSKINSIRTSYRKELNKIHKSVRSEAPTGLHVPKLWYFHLLDFLRDHVNPRPLKPIDPEYSEKQKEADNMQIPNVSDSLDEKVGQKRLGISEEETSIVKKRALLYNRKALENKRSTSYRTGILTRQESGPSRKDRYHAVGKSVAKALRKMDRTQQLFAENIINKALFLGLLGRLTSASDIQTTNIYGFEDPASLSPVPDNSSPDVSALSP